MFQAGCENHLCQFLIIVISSIVYSEKIIYVLKKKEKCETVEGVGAVKR